MGDIEVIIAWAGLCGSVLFLAAAAVSFFSVFRMPSRGQAGSEFVLLALAPFFLVTPLVSGGGAVAAFWLAARTNSTAGGIGLYLAGAVLAVSAIMSVVAAVAGWVALSMFSTAWWSARRLFRSRPISRDEMIRLIGARSVSSFTREAGAVSISYVDGKTPEGEDAWPSDQADPDGFDSYVVAALELAPDFVVEFFDRDSPAEKLYRWITADEAEDLLARGMIKTFSYGVSRFPARDPLSGERTGIKLIDHGWVRHINVEPSMEGVMVPVARAAQRAHGGVPQFCVDNRYEPGPDQE